MEPQPEVSTGADKQPPGTHTREREREGEGERGREGASIIAFHEKKEKGEDKKQKAVSLDSLLAIFHKQTR